MDDRDVSRRLKAARWIAGGSNEKGQVAPLSPEDLADHPELKANGITANAITEFERLLRRARPMELRAIATALELPANWFTDGAAEPSQSVATLDLERLVRKLTDHIIMSTDQHAARMYSRFDEIEDRINAITSPDLEELTRRAKQSLVGHVGDAGGSSQADSGTREPGEATPEAPPVRARGTRRSES